MPQNGERPPCRACEPPDAAPRGFDRYVPIVDNRSEAGRKDQLQPSANAIVPLGRPWGFMAPTFAPRVLCQAVHFLRRPAISVIALLHPGGPVSWCDKLASRPTVGFTFEKHFRPSADLLSAMIPVLDKLAGAVTDKFTLSKQETFAIEFITESGFRYTADPARIAVEFQHRLKAKNISGAAPVAQLVSRQEPYTVLLSDVGERAIEAAELMVAPQRALKRVGVVSSTMVGEADLPPGIMRGIEYLNMPWGRGVPHYNFQIVASLQETDDWQDQCIHIISKPEADEGLVSLVFDYQRIFKTQKERHSIRATLAGVQEAALDYFEELAQGDMFNATDDISTQ